jgi:hypothetical protein
LVLFNEIARIENRGLESIVLLAGKYAAKYNMGMADLIHYMSTHATVTCPLGPRVRTFIGRQVSRFSSGRDKQDANSCNQDATQAAPDSLLPNPFSDADTLINLFQDKTISPHDLTALVGAHSNSKQFSTSPKDFGEPQDSTPGVWDVSFYNETLQPSPKENTFRLASDVVISQDPRTSDYWQKFIGGQRHGMVIMRRPM